MLSGLFLRLPLYAEAAHSEARLAGVRCLGGLPQNAAVDIDAFPGPFELALGDVDESALTSFGTTPRVRKARILDASVLRIDAVAHVEGKNLRPTRLSFSPTEIAAGTHKSASTQDALTSMTGSLLRNLDADIGILFLSIGTPTAVQRALADTLATATVPLDRLLYNLLLTLGIRIGEADVRVTDVACRRPVLVQ